MDDLDHSMHIAEYDWTSFYEESEECGLLQPSLACPDNLSLSDSEDSGNSCSGQREPQQGPAAKHDEADSDAAGSSMEGVQINQSGSREQDDLKTKAEGDSETCLDRPGGKTLRTEEVHVTNDGITTTLQTEQINVQSSDGEPTELKKKDSESDTQPTSLQEPDSCNQTELNVNELDTTDRAVSEDVSGVALRAEKERWFVTVNDAPARQRKKNMKKKRRPKKLCKVNHVCRTLWQEKSLEKGAEMNEDNDESEGEKERSGGEPSAEENPESVQVGATSDLSQMSSTSGEEDNLSEKLLMSHSHKENIIEPRNKHDTSSSVSTSYDTFMPKDPSRLDSVESEDGVEFFSTHSYDSESYLSATESVEETQHLLMENQHLQSSNNSCLFSPTENTHTNDTQDREMDSSLPCSVKTSNSEGYKSTNIEQTLTYPSAGQSVNKMPDVDSTCDNDTHSTMPRMPSDTPGLQKHEINLSASGCSSGDQPSPLPVPDLTVTLCSVADSPEAYAEAAGHARPVYAISAFWDEMEKLTINDILQLRMGRSTPPRETQETVAPNDFPTSSLVDTVEYNLTDGGLMDTSDTADSDYFTQPDESKPDRSSCEFSTSDFEEEYWQFLGTSRNPSPDPISKNQQGTSGDPPFFEEEGSTSSEGKETPVPSEDFAGQCFEDQDSFISSEIACPRRMMKSKSVRNVHALNTEDLSLQVLLGNDERSLFLSSCPSLEENMVLKARESLETLIPAAFLSNKDVLDEHTQTFTPEGFEYFLTEDGTNSQCVTVYNPEDISVAPVFDYTFCTYRDEISSLHYSQCNMEKPIPIFTCSHPTVRELTFPNPDYVFFSADSKEEDDISPIRVVSRAFMQGTSSAVPHGFPSWKSLLSIRKIRFHDKGSIWCGSSGAWVFPVEAEKITIKRADPPLTVLTEEGVPSSPSQVFRELAAQPIFETIQTTRQESVFSTLRQSDMCLICIAFASWVLKSSDPEAADAWKAALLANVSALSAIQYLRHYVKKKNPS